MSRVFVDASYLFGLAKRCLTAAEQCLERHAQEEFQEIAQELICKANDEGVPEQGVEIARLSLSRRLQS
jgi:hypothetical protein